jgi:hypothetical protein
MRNTKSLALGATLATAAFAVVTTSAIAARADVSLAQAASSLGYTYSYLGPEDAVQLGRPGVTILVRPGERLFDVNDRTEAMAGSAPKFVRDDLYVSAEFVARLRAIAARYPAAQAATSEETTSRHTAAASAAKVSGPITAFEVRQKPGTEQVDVTGKAPAPGVPITLTLVGTFSSDIPDTVLTRRQVFAGPDGRFTANVSVTPGNLHGALLTMVASSVPGVASASIRFEMKAPNADLKVPVEQEARSIR